MYGIRLPPNNPAIEKKISISQTELWGLGMDLQFGIFLAKLKPRKGLWHKAFKIFVCS